MDAEKAGMEGTVRRLLTVHELATYVGVPPSTLYTWACLKRIPSTCIVRLGRSLKFDIQEVDKWIEASKAAQR